MYVSNQAVMPFATVRDTEWVPVNMGGKGPALAMEIRPVFSMDSWAKDILARPASAREVDASVKLEVKP